MNAPLVQSINLDIISGVPAPFRFEELQALEAFDAQHVFCGDSVGFAKSVSSCPNLERINTYKFRGLDEQVLILPKCTYMRLHRAEGLYKLEILYAPQLE